MCENRSFIIHLSVVRQFIVLELFFNYIKNAYFSMDIKKNVIKSVERLKRQSCGVCLKYVFAVLRA